MKKTSIVVFFAALSQVHSAPRSKDKTLPTTVYDQKQTGDYNIQLHLKDFQIIALLSDGALGDYDYDYDYADFTIKPPNNITVKPPSSEEATTAKPNIPSTQSSSSEKPSDSTPTTTSKTETGSNNNNAPEKTTPAPVALASKSPDKIKVQIIQDPAPNVSIVPSEEIGTHTPALGEILHYRRCATGYARDKNGRCRRVRRPGVPFNIGRLATNLAARFRQVPAESVSSSESESSKK